MGVAPLAGTTCGTSIDARPPGPRICKKFATFPDVVCSGPRYFSHAARKFSFGRRA